MVRIYFVRTLGTSQRFVVTKKKLNQGRGNLKLSGSFLAFYLLLFYPLLTLAAFMKMAAHVLSVGPSSLVLEGAEQTLFSKNCVCWLPEGLT